MAVEEIKGKLISRPVRVAYIAPTYQQARDIAWSQLKKELNPAIKNVNESRLEITVRTIKSSQEKSTLVLRGWESVETLRGQYFDFIVLDEVASMRNFWEHWMEVIRPTLTDTKGEALFISTPKGYNHFYELYSKDPTLPMVQGIIQDNDFKSFTFTTYDNPVIPKEEVDKAREQLTEDRFEQEYMASFRKMEGLVYKEFRREEHVFNAADKPFRNVIEKIAGVDFGYTNPTAILPIDRDSDGHYWISDEFYKRGKTTPEIIEYTKSLSPNKVYPDPAEPDRIEEMRRAGINVQEVSKDIEAGINSVRELFKTGRIHISSNCVHLISELESYHYPDKKPNNNEPEIPIKEDDHTCFLAGTMVGRYPIEKIGFQTGKKEVYEYQIAGQVLIATPNHPVLTCRGMVPIDRLRYDDVVWKNKSSFSMVSGSLGFLNTLIALKGFISVLARRLIEVKERDYTDTFGVKLTEKYHVDQIFTTLTATPLIILWVIFACYSAVNTLGIITTRKGVSGLKRILRKLSRRPLFGLKQKLGKSFDMTSGRPMSAFSSIGGLSRNNVTCVQNNMKPEETEETVSAIQTAVRRRYVGREPVYNLKTKNGMYLANGILVSNCDALRYALHMQAPVSARTHAHQFYPKSVIKNDRQKKPWEIQWIDRI